MSKARILIVEDEQIIALDIKKSLVNNGYVVVDQTNSGEDAIIKAEQQHPDLILMDIGLKGEMDGIEAATQIRARFDLPVIFLTAFANPSTLQLARQAEPFAYVLKPFIERELVSNIEMSLYKHNIEKKLRESENKFRSVIEHASDGIALIDNLGKVIEWNPAIEHITGLKRSEVFNQPIWEVVFRLLPEEQKTDEIRKASADRWNVAIKNDYLNADQMAERDIKTPQGVRRIIQSNGFSIKTIKGVLGGVIIRDITARKLAEEALMIKDYAIASSINAIVISDLAGNLNYVNAAFLKMWGYDHGSEVLGKPLDSFWAYGEQASIVMEALQRNGNWIGEGSGKKRDSSYFEFQISAHVVKSNDGRSLCIMASFVDISDRKMLERVERDQRQLAEALRDTAMTLSSSLKLDDVLDRILENIGKLVNYDAAMVSLIEEDKVRRIRYRNNYQNSSNQPPIGEIQANLLNIPILRTIIKTKQPQIIQDIHKDTRWQVIAVPSMQRIRSLLCAPIEIHGNVAGVINVISTTPGFFTTLHAERIVGFASQAAIAMENAQLYEQAKRLSATDPLTELFNMRYFLDFARLEFERNRRFTRTLSVVMVDIDHFKNVNDCHGHSIGDLTLREIATRIKSSVRTVDIVARYGGEEFIVLLPETSLDEARQIAERMRRIIADTPIKSEGIGIAVTLSLGVAQTDQSIESFDLLMKHADQALYMAKAKGRNRVEIYFQG